MTIGISRDQDICLILEQVSPHFTQLEEKPPSGYMWSWGETDKTGERHPGQIICGQKSGRNWEEMLSWRRSRNGHMKNQNSIMLEDHEEFISVTLRTREFKETIGNVRKELETPMAPAVPCKTCKKYKHEETRSKTNDCKSKFACTLEASESTRMRMEESLPKYHEDHIAGKGDNSLQHYNLVHKFIPMPQAMKIPAAKAAVDKELEKLEKIWRGT